MPFFAGEVKVAGVIKSHDIAPVEILLKYIQHLLLLHHFLQHIRILFIGNAQQEAIIVFHDVEQLDISGTGEQITIIIIDRIAQRIIIGI